MVDATRSVPTPMPFPARKTAPFLVRTSSIHGRGAFATRAVRTGGRIGEYVGKRVTDAEAERQATRSDGHTMLFEVAPDVVIDGSQQGNAARFINHSCAPNCESVIRGQRVFLVALRPIAAGDELGFDYNLIIDGPYRRVWTARYRCRCGAPRCRGTMLRLRPQNRVGREYRRLLRERELVRKKQRRTKNAPRRQP